MTTLDTFSAIKIDILNRSGFVILLGRDSSITQILDRELHIPQGNSTRKVLNVFSKDNNGDSLYVLINPHDIDVNYASFVRDVLNLTQEIFGTSVLVEGTYLITKPAFQGMVIPWHQDAALDAYRTTSLGRRLSMWIPLQDTGPLNGGLWVYPSSHTIGLLPHETVIREIGLNTKKVSDKHLSALVPAVPVHLKVGDMLLLDDKLVHGSLRNESIHPRHALAIDLLCI